MNLEEKCAAQARTINRLKKELNALISENADLISKLEFQGTPSIIANGEILSVEPNIYDQEERHENCTVQVLRNTLTGAYSFGWWENES